MVKTAAAFVLLLYLDLGYRRVCHSHYARKYPLAVFVPPSLQDIHKLNTSLNSGSNAEYVIGAKFAFYSAANHKIQCDVVAVVYWDAVHREATGNYDIKCGMELNNQREISFFFVHKLIQLVKLELEALNANTEVCYVTMAVWLIRIFTRRCW